MEGQKEYVCFCLGAIHLFLSQTFYRFDESFGTWSEIIYQCGIAIGKVFVVSTVPFVKQVAECAAHVPDSVLLCAQSDRTTLFLLHCGCLPRFP